MSFARLLVPLLAAGALAACSHEEAHKAVAEHVNAKPPAEKAAPAPTPAPTPATPAPPAAAATTKAGLPASGDAAQRKSPDFYMPSDSELTKTPSGLKYLVVREGSGTKPTAKSTFTGHYCGWFPDGRKFESSYDSNEPLSYPVNRMIKGWQEALQLMAPGAEYILVVPPDLAYGPGGNGMPPNATLVFRMELLSVSG